ncbi:exosome complex exonuclease Rrp41 [Candidatus Marsarchaeota archaeon]|jgi:exosome complex component RRP41|nr:exosome complex exonuclease Rrp41 [Candidatus Marsarchaeota archaeon]MCL5092219.1 exosome complex exonuclease Rrp41 [Candidatus Marsarchaeota archaeon]
MGSSLNKPELLKNGKRLDGRDFNELRPLKIEAGILKNAAGSAYLEWGNNKVLAAVYGPKDAMPRHMADPTKAIIKCRYSMAPFSSIEGHGRSGPNRRAIEISKVTKEVFENVVMLEEFPGNEIDVFIEILQSDGGTRAAGITAASVALANAGIKMKDLVYAVSAGRIGEHVVLDVNMIEDNYSDADMPMTISPRNNNVLLLQMDGGFSKQQFKEAAKMVIDAGKKISSIQRAALENVYNDKKEDE